MSKDNKITTYDHKQRARKILVCLFKVLLFVVLGFVAGYVLYTFMGA